MNLKILSNPKLIESTHSAKSVESQSTMNVVRHFVEIYRRDLYLARGFSSMFLMATEEFGYDKASAQRRVNAMELALKVPSVLEKIDRDELCLQSVANIQSFLNGERGRKAAYSSEQIFELVEKCTGRTTREVEVELASRNDEVPFTESKKLISKDQMRITHIARVTTEDKLQRIRELRSHASPYMSRGELNDYMAEIVLERIDPIRKDSRAEIREAKKAAAASADHDQVVPAQELGSDLSSSSLAKDSQITLIEESPNDAGEIQLAIDFEMVEKRSVPNLVPAQKLKRNRCIPVRTQRILRNEYRNDGCAFTDLLTGRRCGAKHQEQLDHILEFSRGGSSAPENLQPYCAKHNRFRWRQSSSSQVRSEQLEYA